MPSRSNSTATTGRPAAVAAAPGGQLATQPVRHRAPAGSPPRSPPCGTSPGVRGPGRDAGHRELRRARPASRRAAERRDRPAAESSSPATAADAGRGGGGVPRAAGPGSAGPAAPVRRAPAHQRVVRVAGLGPYATPSGTPDAPGGPPSARPAPAPAGACSRSARSASSRYARGNRSSKPPTATSAARRYAMSAVAQRAVGQPGVTRSQSVGRRSGRQRHLQPALRPGHRRRQPGQVGGQPGRQPGPGSTSSSRNATHGVAVARQPALRAAAGPRAGPGTTCSRSQTGRSSGRSGVGPVVDHDDHRRRRSRRRPAARRAASAATAGRWSGSPPSTRAVTTAAAVPGTGPSTSSVHRRRTEQLQRVPRVVDHRPAGRVEARCSPGTAARSARSNAASRPATSRLPLGVDGLDPRGAVDVHRRPGSGPATPAGPRCTNSMYGTGQRPVEHLGRPVQPDHRRDRAELLAALDVVEPVQRLPPARVGQQRAVPERPRAVLASARRTRPPPRRRPAPRRPRRPGRPAARTASGRCPARPRARRRSSPGRGRRRPSGRPRSPAAAATCSAPPSAVPASPAAGCTQTVSNGPSAASRELATQFSATPPAMVSTRSPVCSCSQRASSQQHLLQPRLHARGQVGVLGVELARPAPAAWPARPSRPGRCGSRRRRWPGPPPAAPAGAAAPRTRPAPSPCTRRTERRKPRCSVTSSYSRPSECGRPCEASTVSDPSAAYRPARWETASPRPSSTSTRGLAGAGRPARPRRRARRGAARTGPASGSSPGSAVARNCGARWAYVVRRWSHGSPRPSSAAGRASAGSKE